MKTQPTNLAIADLLRYFSGRFVSLDTKDGHLGLSLRTYLAPENFCAENPSALDATSLWIASILSAADLWRIDPLIHG